jgi:hypothetical protein
MLLRSVQGGCLWVAIYRELDSFVVVYRFSTPLPANMDPKGSKDFVTNNFSNFTTLTDLDFNIN